MKRSASPTRATPPVVATSPPRVVGFHAKFQVQLDAETVFGDGKAELLALVDELGSLRQAAQRMDMSYRHAWGLVRGLERAAGFRFLDHDGGGKRSRLRLTDPGRAFLAAWRHFRAPLDRAVEQSFRRAFPG